ncbi:MAG: tol-pal system protein YbgF [Pseudomonadota bacterium]
MMRFLFITLLLFPISLYAGEVTVTESENGEAYAPITQDIGARLDRLEQFLNNSALLDMLDVLEQLKLEVSELRGKIEVQTHSLEQLQNKQRELYTDIDSRLQKLENETTGQNAVQEPAEATDIIISESNDAKMDNDSESDPAIEIDPVKAQAEYQRAFKLLKDSRYDQALIAFKKYLDDFSSSDYADNAQYWLGETNYVLQQYDIAISEYQNLLNNYPNSQKASHALLKIGYSYQELGNLEEATKILDEVRSKYPGETAARLADDRLRKLQQNKASNS